MKDTYAFFAHARTAMVYGLRSFDISNDDVVLIPDYICSAVPQALSDVCKFVYYPVNNDFTPDWGKLNKIVGDETKAIMMVHYFGQSQFAVHVPACGGHEDCVTLLIRMCKIPSRDDGKFYGVLTVVRAPCRVTPAQALYILGSSSLPGHDLVLMTLFLVRSD